MTRGTSERLRATLPEKYRPGFVDEMDRRTVMGRAVHDRIAQMESDLGGADTLSHARRSLVRRAVFLELAIEGQEFGFAEGHGVDVGAYTQAMNSYLGVVRLLGIDRRQRPVKRLREALEVTP